MTCFRTLAFSTALSTTLVGLPAMADITPQDVWGAWSSYMESFGYRVTANTRDSDGTLSVSDVAMDMMLPDQAGSVRVTMPGLSFADNGDGTVSIELPTEFPVTMNLAARKEDPVDLTLTYTSDGLDMLASGDPDNLRVDMSAAQLGATLTSLVVDGQPLAAARGKMLMSDVSGYSKMQAGELRKVEQQFDAAALTYDMSFVDPEGSGNMSFAGNVSDMRMGGTMQVPEAADFQEMDAMLKAGLSIEFDYFFGESANNFSVVEDGQAVSGATSARSGTFEITMNDEALRYGFGSKEASLNMSGSEIPIPVSVTMGEVTASLLMPVAKSETPKDFGLLIKLIGLAPDEMIWAMFDPTSTLPHDPANLVIDVTGQANWLFDLFDPEAAESLDGAPGEIQSLSVNDLEISAAGARLTGVGSFTFDNSDYLTFDGVPAPTGSLDLKLTGGNGLLDNLVKMGMLSDQDVFGARAMMGMIARPGEGSDSLLSTIEIKGDGSISANGMRLK